MFRSDDLFSLENQLICDILTKQLGKLHIIPFSIPNIFEYRIIDPLRDIGRGDLDPLGRGGGGMLFNPPFNNPNIFPRGPDRNPLPGLKTMKLLFFLCLKYEINLYDLFFFCIIRYCTGCSI